MNKVKGFAKFLYRCSKAGMLGAGFAIVFILAVISLSRLHSPIDARPDFNNITTGWYLYLWASIFAIYLIGLLVSIGNAIVKHFRRH